MKTFEIFVVVWIFFPACNLCLCFAYLFFDLYTVGKSKRSTSCQVAFVSVSFSFLNSCQILKCIIDFYHQFVSCSTSNFVTVCVRKEWPRIFDSSWIREVITCINSPTRLVGTVPKFACHTKRKFQNSSRYNYCSSAIKSKLYFHENDNNNLFQNTKQHT